VDARGAIESLDGCLAVLLECLMTEYVHVVSKDTERHMWGVRASRRHKWNVTKMDTSRKSEIAQIGVFKPVSIRTMTRGMIAWVEENDHRTNFAYF